MQSGIQGLGTIKTRNSKLNKKLIPPRTDISHRLNVYCFGSLVRQSVLITSSHMVVLGVGGVRVCATLALPIEDRVNGSHFTLTVLTFTLSLVIPPSHVEHTYCPDLDQSRSLALGPAIL